MSELETFTNAFIEAVYFAETGEEGQPSRDAELSADCRLDIEADCRSWWRRFGCYVTTALCKAAFVDPVEKAGQDFLFTRNCHGTGFWDSWPETYANMLTEGAEGYGTFDIYETDDGEIGV